MGEPLARADHFFVNEDGSTVNTRGTFFAARLVAEAPGLKIEDDHALVWMTPATPWSGWTAKSHVWAVAAWLRRARS